MGRITVRRPVVRIDLDTGARRRPARRPRGLQRRTRHHRIAPSSVEWPGCRFFVAKRRPRRPPRTVPERVRATMRRDGKAVKSRWLDLSDRGRARWRVSPRRGGVYTVRVVTPSTATLARSADTDRVRLR